MSEASKRTLAWRDLKRQDGYQSVTIWIPAKVKNAMVNLGFQRHQDLGELLTEAFQAWTPARGGHPAQLVDIRRIEALMDQKIAHALGGQSPAPAPPPADLAPLSTERKRCRKGHEYPASKEECPQCVSERKKAHRKRQAAKRRGAIPT